MSPDSSLLRRIIRGSALYDLVVTLPFATPWTAEVALSLMGQTHEALSLRGEAMPVFTPMHLFFVSLFGVLAVLWAGVRVIQPTAFHGAVDAVGRAVVATWMVLALSQGVTQVLIAFLVMELAGMFAQGGLLLAARKGREGAPVTAR
ncbi:hypothetical protein D7Y13_33180 [Corallococcus praedator]|uniref:Uncharacterized protein n=1 Tax=Corallococcus praedator TaxID=2316724 RepID=A0ABX9Q830_9BACT|nr:MULTISPECIES: hypothetical protein [Corallococcus]RKH32176.1 hypothetical protein D7X75_16685 [Corallococcus sp. CA031C]RKH94518.1 hypothetical protein D7Y13_33180 [Corallococcus praedator]